MHNDMWGLGSKSQVTSHSAENMEQAPIRGNEASPQCGHGLGCERCSSTFKKLRGCVGCMYVQRRGELLYPPRSLFAIEVVDRHKAMHS